MKRISKMDVVIGLHQLFGRFDLVFECTTLRLAESALVRSLSDNKSSIESNDANEMLAAFFTGYVQTGHVAKLEFYGSILDSALFFSLASTQCALERLTIDCDNEYLVDSGLLVALAHAFATTGGSLKHLSLCELGPSPESVFAFFESLRLNRNNLFTLTFKCCWPYQDFVNGAARFVASEHCRLQVLGVDLDEDRILLQKPDISALCRALAGNKTVTNLSLRASRCKKAGAVALCDMLLENKSLRVVDFSDNPCYYKKAQLTAMQIPFCAMIAANTTLRELHLCETLSTKHLDMFATTMLQSNFTLTRVSRARCPFCTADDQCCPNSYDGCRGDEKDKVFQHDLRLRECLQRNRIVVWQESLHGKVVDFCLTFGPLQLPPYVLLEIFDWLPYMEHVRHWNKIQLINGLHRSRRRIMQAKEQK